MTKVKFIFLAAMFIQARATFKSRDIVVVKREEPNSTYDGYRAVVQIGAKHGSNVYVKLTHGKDKEKLKRQEFKDFPPNELRPYDDSTVSDGHDAPDPGPSADSGNSGMQMVISDSDVYPPIIAFDTDTIRGILNSNRCPMKFKVNEPMADVLLKRVQTMIQQNHKKSPKARKSILKIVKQAVEEWQITYWKAGHPLKCTCSGRRAKIATPKATRHITTKNRCDRCKEEPNLCDGTCIERVADQILTCLVKMGLRKKKDTQF